MRTTNGEIQITHPLGLNAHIFFILKFATILFAIYSFGFSANQSYNVKYAACGALVIFLTLDALTKIIPSKQQMTEKVVYSRYGGARIGSLFCSWPLARIIFYQHTCEVRAFGSRYVAPLNSVSIKFDKSIGIFCDNDDKDVTISNNDIRITFRSINATKLAQAQPNERN